VKCEEIVSIVDGTHKAKHKLKRKYYALETPDGSRLLLFDKHNDDVVAYCSEKALISDIIDYSRNTKGAGGLTFYEVKQISQYVIASMQTLEEKPQLLKFSDDPGLCFHKIPFKSDDGDEDKCPLFMELMNRTTNSQALRAFIGSLFLPDSDRSQYVWLWGAGMNGKGCLLRLLQKILNGCFASEIVPGRGNRFWTAGLLGKRLVCFPDCDEPEFPSSGFFKMLTGGDYVRCENKGQAPFSALLDAKYMFLSNDQPILEDSKADMRRAIFCELGPIIGNVDPRYEEKLWQEAPHIVANCVIQYAQNVRSRHIQVEQNSFEHVTAVNSDTMQSIFDQHFEFCYREGVPPKQQPYITGSEMQTVLTKGALLKNKTERSRFLAYLRAKYNVQSQVFRGKNNDLIRGYLGLKPRWFLLGERRSKDSNIIDLPGKSGS
jgi:phage/plasmid-associated DNA primase